MLNTLLKLSPNVRLGIPNNPLPTHALFEDLSTNQIVLGAYEWDAELGQWRPPLTASGLTSFGADPLAKVSLDNRNLLADISDNSRGNLPDSNLAVILVHHIMGSLADPTGLTRTKPLQMTRRNGIGVHFGSFGRLQLGQFEINQAHPNFQGMLDIGIADYRRMVAEGVPQAQLRKVVGFRMLAIYGRMSDEYRDALVPSERRSADPKDDYIRPATPVTDDFNRIDNTVLGSPWTEVAGDIDIVTNRAKAVSSSGVARYGTALSGADMYAQANSFNSVDSADRGCGGAVRYESGADTCYYHRGHRASGSIVTHELVERTAATDVAHSSTGSYTDADGGVHRIEISGSDIELFYNGASRHTASDASITGNLYSGIGGRHTGINRLQWDNFEADILAAGGGIAFSQAVIIG
ncbi:MAG: hypothetical protein O2909_11910 [Chloroflexi bacterium]|nr:hypothetical protein [Chloroflexota bacterium]MDA1220124.1 hypothetical protein [Chloroflexota bacterium]PKB58053.1 MAG: hypothetical protein BZY73_00195 [SAR202 cluster bacterium Casp-Chloro-G3]